MRAENIRHLANVQAFDLGWAAGVTWGAAIGATVALLVVMLMDVLARA